MNEALKNQVLTALQKNGSMSTNRLRRAIDYGGTGAKLAAQLKKMPEVRRAGGSDRSMWEAVALVGEVKANALKIIRGGTAEMHLDRIAERLPTGQTYLTRAVKSLLDEGLVEQPKPGYVRAIFEDKMEIETPTLDGFEIVRPRTRPELQVRPGDTVRVTGAKHKRVDIRGFWEKMGKPPACFLLVSRNRIALVPVVARARWTYIVKPAKKGYGIYVTVPTHLNVKNGDYSATWDEKERALVINFRKAVKP